MLLVAALHHAVRDTDQALAAALERVLVRSDAPGRTKLRPHDAWADLYESVVLDRRDDADRESRFDDNYAFFRSQIHVDEVPLIWRGLQKLEHVSITLGAQANAQQIFESLNSTGEPLRDHELIHNYILMGLSHAEQVDVESRFWVPIERHTGEAIGAFWRHYLVLITGREVAANGEHGVYSAFRQSFPRVDLSHLQADASEWRHHAEIYGILLDPSREQDPEIAQQLRHVNTFGRSSYPLVMSVYSDHARGVIDRSELIETLEWLQTLYLRRALVNLPTERLVARLCRARRDGRDALARAFARITPSDERVSAVLKYSELPHPAYVLGRLEGVDDLESFDVEHIVPVVPGDTWSGDGERPWIEYTEDEQNSHRALAPDPRQPDPARTAPHRAGVRRLVPRQAHGRLRPQFRTRHARPRRRRRVEHGGDHSAHDRTHRRPDPHLGASRTPGDRRRRPDADPRCVRRRGWPTGWEREFDYVEYRGERWEVPDVKYLFNRVFRRAWTDTRTAALAYCAAHGGPIYQDMAWKGQWDALDEGHFLYMGWDSNYMMTAVQGVLEESGIASEVFVKYSYIGNVM